MSDFDELDDKAFRERLREQAEAAGLPLDLTALGQFEEYFRILRHWNQTINLTALPFAGLPDRTLNRLFIEPLQAAQLVGDAPLVWFDLGSGGGSPAIPLKIARPLLRLTMIESKSRKAAFLREAARILSLTSTVVLSVRIEELARSAAAGQAHLLTMRAVRVEEELLRLAWALLEPEGRMLLFGFRPPSATLKGAGFRATDELTLAGGESTLQVLTKSG